VIKEIDVGQVRLGMFVHEFGGAWIDHPFWRAHFTLDSQEDFGKIRNCGLRTLWIDTSKGLDVETAAPPPPLVLPVETTPNAGVPVAPASAPVSATTAGGAVSKAELEAAAKVCRQALPQIATLFGDVRMGKAIDPKLCDGLVDAIADSATRNPSALISVVRLKRRDEYTFMHSMAVCALMISLGRQLGLRGRELSNAGLAGLLHDVGKAQVPLEILNKPGKLTADEFAQMSRHPQLGASLLRTVGGIAPSIIDVCLHHHEKIDGSGYLRLSGDQISLHAKMGAVCDVYDALTSDRPYKAGWNPSEALRRMAQWNGHFEQRVFHALVALIGIYPVGSLVRLESRRLAVVVAQQASAKLAPTVKAFFDLRSNLRITPTVIDLARPSCQDAIAGWEATADWNFKDLDTLWCPSLP
jgi:putative nucleotidyltransferase with HDIG domain